MRTRLALPVLFAALSASVAAGCVTKDAASGRGTRAGARDPVAPVKGDPAACDPLPANPDALPPTRRITSGKLVYDPSAKARKKVEEDAAFFEEKLDTARGFAAAGQDDAALELVSATLRLDPPAPWDARLKSLRLEMRAKHVDREILRADVRGEKEFVPFDADVDLVVRVRNVGTSDVVIHPPEGMGEDATSGSSFVLSITRRDRDIYGAQLSRSWTQVVPLVSAGMPALRIPPETSHEVRVRMPAADAGGAIAGVRVLEVGGVLRAGKIETCLGEPLGRVPIRAGRVVVLPGNFEPLALDPVGSMRKAVAATAPVHLVVAAEFVPAGSRPEVASILAGALSVGAPELRPACLNALRTLRRAAAGTPLRPLAAPLMEALSAHPERSADIMEGLSAMTGVALAPDARLWQDWWRREGQGPGSPVAPEEEDVGRSGSHSGAKARGK